jgi:hypothetical protein
MPITSYDFQNQVRDVVPLLDYVNQNNPKLLSKIAAGAIAKNKTHEWTEGILAGKKVAGTASGLTITVDGAAGLAVGMKLQPVAAADVYVINAIAGNAVTVAKLADAMANPPAAKTTYKVYGAAVVSGSKTGEEVAWQGKTRVNYTQIFRKDASLTGTAVATSTYDNANSMNTQVMAAMELLQNDLNFAIWHGRKGLGGAGVASTMGGLYEFCNAIVEDAEGEALTVDLINTVIGKIVKAGGRPNTIVMARDLAPAVSNLYKDQVIIGEDSNVRGMYVNKIKDAFGNILDVIYDDEVPAGHLWILDITKVKLSPMEGRTFTDADSTLPGFDGFSRTIIGEYTLEIYNPEEAFGRIENIG